ncbi:peptidyl-prolyl cis-trans isomerase [Qipengyuania sp. JC766]|uniref:peptidylprolyl isomerase n=1 Tax=Qipengyuania sp. JC766 TaxID=3232139 RepID=UPI003457B3FF
MLTSVRKFFSSAFGIVLFLVLLGIIAVGFTLGDVGNNAFFGGVAGGDRAAVVGDRRIDSAELAETATAAVDRIRREERTYSMQAFLEEDGLNEVLDQLIERAALGEWAQKYGFRAGENLVNSQILLDPNFRGSDGNFDPETFRALLGQINMSEAEFRAEQTDILLAQQVLVPAAFGAKVPQKVALRYGALLKEQREGAIGFLPSQAYAPSGDPTDEQLQSYYTSNRGDYLRPERRVIRYAVFGPDQVTVTAPTDAEIRASYQARRAEFQAIERRTITQFIVPTQQAATSFRQRIAGGTPIATAAQEAGLGVTNVGPVTREELAAQTSTAVANAVFAASEGSVAQPARSGLGFHVAVVDDVERQEARTLAQARDEIAETLQQQKTRAALDDLADEIEDEVTGGSAITDIARALNVDLETTRPLTGNGLVYGTQDEQVDEVLAPALATAFEMPEGEPELAVIEQGGRYLVFEVNRITQSAAAPLSEIRDQVVADWKLSRGLAEARKAADRIITRLGRGSDLAAALREEDRSLPQIENVDLNREQLARGGQQIPPPLALLFSMAEGTSKKLEAPSSAGWYIVDLNDIEANPIESDDPLFTQTQAALSQSMGREYSDQLRLAIREEIGIERNEDAIAAVRRQLNGNN